ncbi:MAG: penicillin-binding transpeptidase domain-containing protein [Phycisphaeraceae bacterium]
MFDRFIPSMFKRRLLLLAIGAALVLGVILIQLVRLTVVQGAQWREKAEQALTSHRLIPTARGSIFDRHGRILAVDKPSYDVAVMYEIINGDWAYRQARQQAWKQNRHRWQELSADEREKLVVQFQPQWNAQVDELWTTLCKLGRIDRDALEQRKAEVIRRVEQIASDVWARQQERRAAELEEEGQIEPPPLVKRPISEHRSPHAILENVSEDTLLQVRHMIALAESRAGAIAKDAAAAANDDMKAWEHVSIQAARQRVYPLETLTVEIDLSTFPGALRKQQRVDVTVEGVAWAMVGDLRPIWREDVERRPYSRMIAEGEKEIDLAGYLPGDRTGRWGIEQAFEDVLRGHRGRILEYVDSSHEDIRTDPIGGKNVTLTLDVRLQARIQAIMDPRLGLTRVQPWHAKEYSTIVDVQPGEESTVDPLRPALGESLNAAAVVIDIGSGEVLAAVSMPTVGKRQLRDDPDSVWKDTLNRPFTNRAIGVPYQPGSTMKPVTLLAAVAEGLLAADGLISCTGHLYPNLANQYRCWIYKHYNGMTHDQVVGHALDGAAAIARSCNIFFYTLGQRLGTAKLVTWFRKFGLGRTFDIGLAEESRGRLPSIIDAREPHRGGPSEAIMMGIGQGRVEWTVLQAANAYATIARGGYMLAPTLIRDIEGQPPRTRHREDLKLDPRAIDIAMQGLFEAVNKPYGTAHQFALLPGKPAIFDFPGVKIFGKSGTATAPPLREPIDDDGDGYPDRYGPPLRVGDHAWFVGFVQKPGSDRPDYAIAVVVEYGGSGGAVAGPIGNQILYAMRAEGYLP